MHDVLRVLAARAQEGSQPGARDDGYRIALAIEGGGMRGTISAGMALALDELGLAPRRIRGRPRRHPRRRQQPRRCHIGVALATSMSHRRGPFSRGERPPASLRLCWQRLRWLRRCSLWAGPLAALERRRVHLCRQVRHRPRQLPRWPPIPGIGQHQKPVTRPVQPS